MSPMEKQLGHVALILYSFEVDAQKKEMWQQACKKHWSNYVQWHRDDIIAKDSMWSTIESVIEAKDFSHLRLV